MGKKKTTKPTPALQLIPTPAESVFKLDQKASDELKALITEIANYNKPATDEDPPLLPAA